MCLTDRFDKHEVNLAHIVMDQNIRVVRKVIWTGVFLNDGK